MILDNPINEDYRVQSLRMRFNSIVQENKLIIQATCEGDNSQYTGKVVQNPHFSFNQLVEHLEARTFGILSKNQDILRLEIMHQQVELYSMSRLELNELKETTRVLNQRQEDFRLMIHAQIHELNNIKDEIKKLEIKELKDDVKKSIERQEEFRMIVQSQNDEIEDVKDEMNKFKLEIKKTTEEIKKINEDSLKSEMMKITTQINQIKNQSNKSIEKVRDNCEIKINEESKKIIKNSKEIDEVMRKVEKSSNELGSKSELKLGLENKRNESINEIEKVEMKSEKIMNNEHLKKEENVEYKWSKELKSDGITIEGNIITLSKCEYWHQFILLNASFSNTIESKQLWTIKINEMTRIILLGVCLKSKMIKYNFNDQNMNWEETGHGLYMIHSNGWCFSHEYREFNWVEKSFKFDVGDVILIEYDPIECKLRFIKNLIDDYFEMTLTAPPENDAYHPCVSLCGENESVELIHPVEFPKEVKKEVKKEVNDQKNKGFWSNILGF